MFKRKKLCSVASTVEKYTVMVFNLAGFEPAFFCIQVQCSSCELPWSTVPVAAEKSYSHMHELKIKVNDVMDTEYANLQSCSGYALYRVKGYYCSVAPSHVRIRY
jgi:hypothetical protein